MSKARSKMMKCIIRNNDENQKDLFIKCIIGNNDNAAENGLFRIQNYDLIFCMIEDKFN